MQILLFFPQLWHEDDICTTTNTYLYAWSGVFLLDRQDLWEPVSEIKHPTPHQWQRTTNILMHIPYPMDTNVIKLNITLTAMLTLPRISSGILLASFNTWSREPPSSRANKGYNITPRGSYLPAAKPQIGFQWGHTVPMGSYKTLNVIKSPLYSMYSIR